MQTAQKPEVLVLMVGHNKHMTNIKPYKTTTDRAPLGTELTRKAHESQLDYLKRLTGYKHVAKECKAEYTQSEFKPRKVYNIIKITDYNQ